MPPRKKNVTAEDIFQDDINFLKNMSSNSSNGQSPNKPINDSKENKKIKNNNSQLPPAIDLNHDMVNMITEPSNDLVNTEINPMPTPDNIPSVSSHYNNTGYISDNNVNNYDIHGNTSTYTGIEMNNMIPVNSNQIFVNESSLWNLEWTLPSVRTYDDNGNEIYSYKDLMCSISVYDNDIYTLDTLIETSRRMFGALHTIMDAIRRHGHLIDPNGESDYMRLIDADMLNLIDGYRQYMLNKRMGYPRITIKSKWGFKIPGSGADIKIVMHEHTDPLDLLIGSMKSLESMRKVEMLHSKIEEQMRSINPNLKSMTNPPQQVQPIRTAVSPNVPPHLARNQSQPQPQLSQSQQQSQHIINYDQTLEQPSGPVSTGIVDCQFDDDVQAAEFGSTVCYYPDKIYRKDGKWNFYMPCRDGRSRPRGIYAFENGGRGRNGDDTKINIENALRDGILPNIQNGEMVNWKVKIIAYKDKTQNDNAKYIIQAILPA